MACRGPAVQIRLAPLNFDSDSNRIDIITTAFNIASAARKTVDNTLGNMVNNKQLRRPKKGIYALNPKDVQRLNLVPDHTLGTTIGKSVNSSYTNQIDLVSSHDIETPL